MPVELLRRREANAVNAVFFQNVFEEKRAQIPRKYGLVKQIFCEERANFSEDVGVKYYNTYSESESSFQGQSYANPKKLI